MLIKIVVACAVFAAAALGIQQFEAVRTNANVTSCLGEVAKFDAAYTKSRPESESGPSNLQGKVPAATKACNEAEFAKAVKILNTGWMICRLNNGCGERERPKGKVRP